MGKVTRFEELQCWVAARELTVEIYKLSANGMLSKDYGMKNQIRRASLSIMNNIAEGFTRYSKKEFVRFLDIGQSSAGEVKSMIYLMDDLNYFDKNTIESLHQKVDKARNLTLGMLKYLVKKMEEKDKSKNEKIVYQRVYYAINAERNSVAIT